MFSGGRIRVPCAGVALGTICRARTAQRAALTFVLPAQTDRAMCCCRSFRTRLFVPAAGARGCGRAALDADAGFDTEAPVRSFLWAIYFGSAPWPSFWPRFGRRRCVNDPGIHQRPMFGASRRPAKAGYSAPERRPLAYTKSHQITLKTRGPWPFLVTSFTISPLSTRPPGEER